MIRWISLMPDPRRGLINEKMQCLTLGSCFTRISLMDSGVNLTADKVSIMNPCARRVRNVRLTEELPALLSEAQLRGTRQLEEWVATAHWLQQCFSRKRLHLSVSIKKYLDIAKDSGVFYSGYGMEKENINWAELGPWASHLLAALQNLMYLWFVPSSCFRIMATPVLMMSKRSWHWALLRSCKLKVVTFFIKSIHLMSSFPLFLHPSTFPNIIVFSSEPCLLKVWPNNDSLSLVILSR